MQKIILFLLLLAVNQVVMAQQIAPTTGLELTLNVGALFGGSGHSMEKQMKENGFGEERSFSGFFGSEDNPLREESAVQLSLLFPVRNKYQAKALFNYRGSDVSGYAFNYDELAINTSVLTMAAVGYVPVKIPYFRIGAGPAYHQVKGNVTYGGSDLLTKKPGKLGFVLESGVRFPANTRFFADVQGQYFYVGKEDLGSHTVSYTDFDGSTTSRTANFSNTRLSNFTISIGAGFRFRKV